MIINKCIIKEMVRRAWVGMRIVISYFIFIVIVTGILIAGSYLIIKLDESYPWIGKIICLAVLSYGFYALVRKIIEVYKEVKEQCERCE